MSSAFRAFILQNSDNFDNDIKLSKIISSPQHISDMRREDFIFYEELFYRKNKTFKTGREIRIECPIQNVIKFIQIIDFYVDKNDADNQEIVDTDGTIFLLSKTKNINVR